MSILSTLTSSNGRNGIYAGCKWLFILPNTYHSMMEILNGEAVIQPKRNSISDASGQKDSLFRGSDEHRRDQRAETQPGDWLQGPVEAENTQGKSSSCGSCVPQNPLPFICLPLLSSLFPCPSPRLPHSFLFCVLMKAY